MGLHEALPLAVNGVVIDDHPARTLTDQSRDRVHCIVDQRLSRLLAGFRDGEEFVLARQHALLKACCHYTGQ